MLLKSHFRFCFFAQSRRGDCIKAPGNLPGARNMYAHKTHCVSSRSTKPGRPNTPITRAFQRLKPRVMPVIPAVAPVAQSARKPSRVLPKSRRAMRSGARNTRRRAMRKKAAKKAASSF